jgi:tRNA threonylcarbamoyl adenosine modification protein YeaZ
MKLILDSSVDALFAVAKDNDIVFSKRVKSEGSLSENLFLNIDEIFKKLNITFSDISEIIYGAGPGSFTGLRIVYSAVAGFSLARSLPSFGVSSLKALIYNLKDKKDGCKCAVINSSAKDLYAYVISPDGSVLLGESCYKKDEFKEKIKDLSKIYLAGNIDTSYFSSMNNIITANVENFIVPEAMLFLYNNKEFIKGINYLKPSYAEIEVINGK